MWRLTQRLATIGKLQRNSDLPWVAGIEDYDPPTNKSFVFWGLIIIEGTTKGHPSFFTMVDNICENVSCFKMNFWPGPAIVNRGAFPDVLPLDDWFHFREEFAAKLMEITAGMLYADADKDANVFLVLSLVPLQLLLVPRKIE